MRLVGRIWPCIAVAYILQLLTDFIFLGTWYIDTIFTVQRWEMFGNSTNINVAFHYFPTFRLIFILKKAVFEKNNYFCIVKYALTDKNEQLSYDIQAF